MVINSQFPARVHAHTNADTINGHRGMLGSLLHVFYRRLSVM